MADVEGTVATANNSEEAGSQDQGNNTEKQTSGGLQAALRKELRGDERLGKFGNASELAEEFLNQSDKLSQAVLIPGENASEQELVEFRRRLGVPEKPDEYEFEEGLPDEMQPKTFDKWYKDIAHSAGLSKSQAAALRKAFAEQYSAGLKEVQKHLREKYGDKYEENIVKAQRVVKTLGGDEFVSYLEETGLGNDPRMVDAMVRFAGLVSEDTLISGSVDGAQNKGTKSPYGDWMKKRFS
jgi:hypothetical protein